MNQPAYDQSQNDFSDMPVGEILRRTRLHYNRTIEEVEAALRIQGKQIHAIEVGDTESLPARVYAIGFVRSYAEYLGLDGEKIVQLFKAQSEQDNTPPSLKFPEQKAEEERQRAEEAQQRAEEERQRAEQLAARLRSLGIDPDTLT